MTEQERKELSAKLSKATKQYMSNLTEEELAKRVDKRAKTMASKTEEEKREIGRKCSEGAKSFWINLTDEEMDKIREQRANLLYERWNNMTDEDKKYFSEHMSEVQLAKTGGVTEIATYFRNSSFVQEWKDKARKEANYICNITNKQGKLPVHHLNGFNLIIRDAHIVNSIEIKKTIGEYSKEELYKLEEYVESWHKDSSNAVVLSEEVHMLFHSLYGYGDNTLEQFEEFKQRYLNGEFKDLLGGDLND